MGPPETAITARQLGEEKHISMCRNRNKPPIYNILFLVMHFNSFIEKIKKNNHTLMVEDDQ